MSRHVVEDRHLLIPASHEEIGIHIGLILETEIILRYILLKSQEVPLHTEGKPVHPKAGLLFPS